MVGGDQVSAPKDRSLAGRKRVRARRALARKQRAELADFVERTGCEVVDEDDYMARIATTNEIRARNIAQLSLMNGARPWR